MKSPIKAKLNASTNLGPTNGGANDGADPAKSAMPRPPAKRTSPPILAHAELTEEQLADLRADLEARRIRLADAIETRRQEERELGTMRDVGDEMDDATTEGVASMTSKLLERDVMLLSEIHHAISKFGDGSYGVCEGTGEPIGHERLRLRPWARYSVAHQEELERMARTRGG